MAYITVSNSKKIMRKLDANKLDEIAGRVYKWNIYFFSKRERAVLKGIKELLKDPENFEIEYYEPIVTKDSYKYVYPESQPAYHKDDTCSRLHSNFTNFEIPYAIKEKGKEEVMDFRIWFKEYKYLLEEDVKKFIYKLQIKFPYVGEINPKSIEYTNTGSVEKENYSIPQLEEKIDDILRAAGKYFTSNPRMQNIIRRFQKLTFLAYIHGDIYNNDTGLNDAELKRFLKEYNEKFKIPVKNYLIEYYRLLYNPDMTFDGRLLDKLGFRPCSTCNDNNSINLSEQIEIAEPCDQFIV